MKRNHTISIRLSDMEFNQLVQKSEVNNMTHSQYIVSKIMDEPANNTLNSQEIVRCMCKIQIELQRLGVPDSTITEEVSKICHMLLW